jgi:hypothetical protein
MHLLKSDLVLSFLAGFGVTAAMMAATIAHASSIL